MRVSYLKHLCCPAPRPKRMGRCGGRLTVEAGEIPLRPAEDDLDELLEGNVVCENCGAWYPVLGGVLILVSKPRLYLGGRFSSMMAFAGLHADLSVDARRWLLDQHFDLYEVPKQQDKVDSNAVLHYERVSDLMSELPLSQSFRAFLQEWDGKAPYDVLAEMGGRLQEVPEKGFYREKNRLAVDAGCGAGGLVYRLAEHYETVFGIDLSFSSILLARSILLHRPRAFDQHFVRTERDAFVPRDLDRARLPNVELVVADCTILPFDDESADAVASANVVDVVHPHTPLREAARVIRRAGLLLFTDPFKIAAGTFSSVSRGPLEDTKNYLATMGLHSVAEQDFVPWIWYRFKRQVQIYFNYCAAFRKEEKEEET
ncbi:MAG: class I SAM-dependent methyltransferase [Nitrospinota bacterium]